ncbi:MAG: bacteriohemerythrin [Rhodospirillales bacterium]|jgi:hemerythrin-like metal-binding protein
MAITEWSDDFKIGEKEVDKEHWGLFALINDLAEKHAIGADKASLDSTLKALIAYVDVHFEHEERLMEETGYPKLEEHKKIHAALDQKVDEFHNDFENSPETFDYDKLMEFLSTWLSHHILKVDMDYANYLKESHPERASQEAARVSQEY